MARQETSKSLTDAQREHFSVLVAQLTAAENELTVAQRMKDAVQSNANGFLIYCAREHNVPLGADGWEFDQAAMRFVQPPLPQGNEGRD